EAYGVTGILGLNYHPNEKFNLGMRYETETKLDFNNKETNLKNGFKNSTKDSLNPVLGDILYGAVTSDPSVKQWTEEGNGERNLPAMAAMGASYKATDRLTLLASGNYYFIKGTGDTVGNYKNYDNGYDLAVGLDYILNEKFTFMTGYQYTNTGANEKTYTDTDYPLDANMYSVGLKYNYSEQLQFIGAYSYVDYKPGTNKETQITYKKRVEAFGVSATYKF
uniref:OmpP1/FadL family transporter n=1 Tax=uncultured Cetobacterium sp. TaxID=527638 RepID=UPI0026093E76